jgi:REP element-mobilizing transposase RayT
MSDAYVNLIYHIVVSTKNREPFLTGAHQPQLHDYIGGIVRNRGGISLGVNGAADHVHVLAKLRQDNALSNVIRDLKAGATGWLHDVFPDLEEFSWQRGYAAFTVSASLVEQVRRYIANQPIHHRKHSFKDELIKMLRKNEIDFQEEYLFR